ncbi:MAG TPA: alpha/beta hydrolase-fold protein [Bryobacteraceae bacterium]|nr:alpha/beta hydrolase-fold protein [Bryobacteraceae bacterium]
MSERTKAEGRLRLHPRFASRYLSTRRDLIVYLPPGYEASRDRYPVLYLQDGQNLFDPATAFGGQDWHADSTADSLIESHAIEPLIMVGIYNAGVRRISEYTPTRDRRSRKGGKADRYAEMLAREIKPFIDQEYRTRRAAQHTGVGGSSLGALVSLVTGLLYPRVFGKLAILSPSVWWDDHSIISFVKAYSARTRPRTWLDTGTLEGDNPERTVQEAQFLRDALIAKGWSEEENLRYSEIPGAEHNERDWAARFGAILEYLCGRH